MYICVRQWVPVAAGCVMLHPRLFPVFWPLPVGCRLLTVPHGMRIFATGAVAVGANVAVCLTIALMVSLLLTFAVLKLGAGLGLN